MPQRRTVLTRLLALGAAATLGAGLAGPAAAAPIPLAELSAYLNSIQTATSDFSQVNADGSISTGTLYIKRPGRVRFEYNPPEQALVVAGGSEVAVFDHKSNQPPQRFPLSKTPLSIILAPQVNLGQAGMVVGHREDGNSTKIVAQDPAHPEYGNIELVFTADPVELRQWIVTDDSGARTTVVLGALKPVGDLRASLFSIEQAVRGQGSGR